MRELAGLRSILVHFHLEVDDGVMFDGVSAQLGDFAAFARQICAFLRFTADDQ